MATKKSKAKAKVNEEEKGMGALLNPEDTRDIQLSQVQAPVKLPKKYTTDISMLIRRDQKKKGRCVGEAGASAADFFNFIETGKLAGAAARGIYALCKARDGLASEGTYPRVLAKVLTTIGAPTTKIMSDDPTIPEPAHSTIRETLALLEDAYPFRVDTNYAWVEEDSTDALMQAIFQNKVVLGSLKVGKDYSDGRMTAVNPRGRHYILFYGFEVLKNGDVKFPFLNSWSKSWGKDGCGYILWSEMKGNVKDMLAFLDIPNEILQQTKTTYKFMSTLKPGSVGPEVIELQKRLALEPDKDGLPCFRDAENDPTYGPATTEAVQRYQTAKGLVSHGTPDTTGFGQLGPLTRNALNGSVPIKIGLFPRVQELRDRFVAIMAAVGYPIIVTDEYRSKEAQDALYEQGRTKPGPIVTNARGGESLHNFRCAFDVAFKQGAGISYEGDFAMLGKVGKILGLEWGGDWSTFPDKPHFQFTLGYTLADFQAGRVDESKFGEPAKVSVTSVLQDSNIVMSFSHRIKSFLITFLSIAASALGAALVAVLGTPEFGAVLLDFGTWLGSLGVPASVVTMLGLIISEVVRQILNARKIKKAEDEGVSSSMYAGNAKRLELY